MKMKFYKEYLNILKEELVTAMGCTEPIAIAYASSYARSVLGCLPNRVHLAVSGNIIKNVKSVIVPHSGGRKGLATALALGITLGDHTKKLEVISFVKEEDYSKIDEFLQHAEIEIKESNSKNPFDIQLTLQDEDNNEVYLRIVSHHTNIVCIKKNDEVLLDIPFDEKVIVKNKNRKLLNVENIVEFASIVDIHDIKETLDNQIKCNMAIAKEGLKNKWGASIGNILLDSYGRDIANKAKAYAAAGSDARMSGCELPVVINSGSGNQGMTCSIPVIIYANELMKSDEELYRALVVSNLVTTHLKTDIGSLSAYCGAISAGAGAGAGICYLNGGRYKEVAHTIVNALAISSGTICDGAKPSCAAKIASAVEAGLLGYQMTKHNSQFYGGDGIVVKGVENTIKAVSELAKVGMKKTDEEIIHLMINNK